MSARLAALADRTPPLPVRLRALAELRRCLPLTAAAMFVAAITVPIWRITLEAPQYPDGLAIDLYAYPRLGGDVAEVQGLNKYVGFYYPDPVLVEPNYAVHEGAIAAPEWVLGPVLFLGVAAAGAFVALAPTERKLRLGLTAQLVGAGVTFAGTFAFAQYRLYQAGHSLDPDAPLSGVEGFTPPILGGYAIANISGWAWFGPGGYLAAGAFGLLVAAWLARHSDATVGDLPDLVREGVRAIRDRVRAIRDRRGGRSTADDPEAGRERDRAEPRAEHGDGPDSTDRSDTTDRLTDSDPARP